MPSLRAVAAVFLLLSISVVPLLGDVSREVEQSYREQYENRALFLKRPIHGATETLHLRGSIIVPDQAGAAAPIRFKVGDQVRILEVDFRGSSVEFQVASVDQARSATLIFEFGEDLTYTFAQKPVFEQALEETFTEGVTYDQIDSAKESFVQDQFDRLVNQFAQATGTTPDFVIESILEKSPEYSRLQEELESARSFRTQLESDLEEARSRSRRLEADLRALRNDLTEATRAAGELRRQQNALTRENQQTEAELAQLREENQGLRSQLDSVAAQLNMASSSEDQLGNQVESLSESLQKLNAERSQLSQKVESLLSRVDTLTDERDELTAELQDVRRERSRLASDLNTLTSNRESLQATYIRTKEMKEQLETADRLAQALTIRYPAAESDESRGIEGRIHLMTQPIAEFQLVPPATAEEKARLMLEVLSPDTVQFSEEERELYAALGEGLRVEPRWEVWSSELEVLMDQGGPEGRLSPRESGEWSWHVEGVPRTSGRLSFELALLDRNERSVPVAEYQFEIQPAGILSALDLSFSMSSLLVGLVLGGLFGGGLTLLSRKKKPVVRRERTSEPSQAYPSRKDL